MIVCEESEIRYDQIKWWKPFAFKLLLKNVAAIAWKRTWVVYMGYRDFLPSLHIKSNQSCLVSGSVIPLFKSNTQSRESLVNLLVVPPHPKSKTCWLRRQCDELAEYSFKLSCE